MIGFDLRIERGDFTLDAAWSSRAAVAGLFGPTGSGKSTLLMTLAGLVRPRTGRITLDDTVLFDHATGIHLPPERRGLGVVFQEGRLFPHLTVGENLRFAPRRGTGSGPGFEEIVHLLDLEPLLDRSVDAISGGQGRLVAIGRAILSGPRFLLLDEPLAGLDPARRRTVLAYLLRLKDTLGIGMLYVSHVYADFLALVDEAALLDRGRLEAVGPPEDLLGGALDARDAGPVASTLPGTVHATGPDGTEVDCSGARFRLTLPGAAVGDPVFLTIDAQDVLLGVGEPPRTSARNALPAVISEVREAGRRTLVRVDAGPRFWVEVTRDSARSLEIAPGRAVYVLIKSSALRGTALSPRA